MVLPNDDSSQSLKKYLIDSFMDCPSSIHSEGIRNHLRGVSCYKEFKNVDFDNLLNDDDPYQLQKYIYLKRYFLCLVTY